MVPVHSALAWRQRTPPPLDRSGRRGQPTGGIDIPAPMTLARGLEDDQTFTASIGEVGIIRDHTPYIERPRYTPPASGWVSWTDAGPARGDLHMRVVNYRREAGSWSARFPVVAESPTGGMHSMTPSAASRTIARYDARPQMTVPPRERLANAQYSGQTYSQTTTVLRRPR